MSQILRFHSISAYRRLSLTPRHNRAIANSKIFEKVLDKVVSVTIINPLKRKMKDSPKFRESIRNISHFQVKMTHRYAFWQASTELAKDGVQFSEKAKERHLKRRLEAADKDLDNNLTAIVDLIKELLVFISSILLSLLVIYIWGEKEDQNIVINEELNKLEIPSSEIERLINHTELLHTEIVETLLENQKIRDSIQQIIANLSLSS